ncbi:MAG: hypothetical protein JWM80_4957 [Cyanobacteria bacterium RYN_339]|nr:hypothetical protein [Cyanobacteria bacterium RYN_339]
MLKLRVAILATLVVAGCTPGNYNVNVGVTPLGSAVGVATPGPGPSASPAASPSPGASTSPKPSPTPTPPAFDQKQEQASAFLAVGNGTRLAQSFVVKRSGNLKAVALRIKDVGPERVPTLAIIALNGDRPGTGAPLATAQLSPGNQEGAWVSAYPDPPLPVKAGDKYAFVVSMDLPFAVYAGADLDTTYLEGTAFTGLTDGSIFWNKLGQDLTFRTLVE